MLLHLQYQNHPLSRKTCSKNFSLQHTSLPAHPSPWPSTMGTILKYFKYNSEHTWFRSKLLQILLLDALLPDSWRETQSQHLQRWFFIKDRPTCANTKKKYIQHSQGFSWHLAVMVGMVMEHRIRNTRSLCCY